jgi:hypothetical protein
MVKDKYNKDENDFEDFGDFEEYYGLESDVDEPEELDFNNTGKKSAEDCSLENKEVEEIDQ